MSRRRQVRSCEPARRRALEDDLPRAREDRAVARVVRQLQLDAVRLRLAGTRHGRLDGALAERQPVNDALELMVPSGSGRERRGRRRRRSASRAHVAERGDGGHLHLDARAPPETYCGGLETTLTSSAPWIPAGRPLPGDGARHADQSRSGGSRDGRSSSLTSHCAPLGSTRIGPADARGPEQSRSNQAAS